MSKNIEKTHFVDSFNNFKLIFKGFKWVFTIDEGNLKEILAPKWAIAKHFQNHKFSTYPLSKPIFQPFEPFQKNPKLIIQQGSLFSRGFNRYSTPNSNIMSNTIHLIIIYYYFIKPRALYINDEGKQNFIFQQNSLEIIYEK